MGEGCWGASGLGGSWAAECERSAGRSGDERKCWDASGRSWRTGYAGSGFRWEKRIPKRCGGSRARRENFTAVAWKGRRNVAREAARSDGLLLDSYRRPDEFYSLKYSMLEERLEQVREIDGELAYEKMMRAVEKASQEKAMQVERARQVERSSQLPARKRPERSGPKRGGPERDYGPSR